MNSTLLTVLVVALLLSLVIAVVIDQYRIYLIKLYLWDVSELSFFHIYDALNVKEFSRKEIILSNQRLKQLLDNYLEDGIKVNEIKIVKDGIAIEFSIEIRSAVLRKTRTYNYERVMRIVVEKQVD